MIAAVRFSDVLPPFPTGRNYQHGGWQDVTVRCTCGFRFSSVTYTGFRNTRLKTKCPKCEEALEPPVLVSELDAAIERFDVTYANQILKQIGERMDQIRQVIAPACPHCSKPLLDSDITSAVRALIQILQQPETK